MGKKELSDARLKYLEEDYRSFKKLPSKIAAALLSGEWKPEDVNNWIRSSQGHTEKALNDMIKKENNAAFQLNVMKKEAIERSYQKLSNELKHIVDEYLWGKYSYFHWSDIAEREHCSKSTIYEWRYKILETYAYEIGELF